jgi:hypothetical protein
MIFFLSANNFHYLIAKMQISETFINHGIKK